MPTGRRAIRIIDRSEAVDFHKARKALGDNVAWRVIRQGQKWLANPSCNIRYGAGIRVEAETLEELRLKLPPGLSHYPGEAGGVEEVWI